MSCIRPIDRLWSLAGGRASFDFVKHILMKTCDGDVEAAGTWITDNLENLEQLEREWKDKKRECRQLAESFGYCESRTLAPNVNVYRAPEEKDTKTRYLDGTVVSTKGEKFVEIKKKDDWDGGSRGKVKTKGKRGRGFA